MAVAAAVVAKVTAAGGAGVKAAQGGTARAVRIASTSTESQVMDAPSIVKAEWAFLSVDCSEDPPNVFQVRNACIAQPSGPLSAKLQCQDGLQKEKGPETSSSTGCEATGHRFQRSSRLSCALQELESRKRDLVFKTHARCASLFSASDTGCVGSSVDQTPRIHWHVGSEPVIRIIIIMQTEKNTCSMMQLGFQCGDL